MNFAADLDFIGDDLMMPHHASHYPCWLCNVSRAPDSCNPITDCRIAASWKSTLVSPDLGVMVHPSPHEVFNIIGCSRFSFHADLQHTYHMGVDGHFVGSVLADIVLNQGWEGTREDRTERLWELIMEEYQNMEKPVRLSVLRFGMFYHGPGKFACLRGNAMEVHHVLLTLPMVLGRVSDMSRRHQVRHRACVALVELHRIFSEGDVFLDQASSDRALGLAEDFLLCNNALLKAALREDQCFFGMVTKHHLFWHIAYLARFQNPRWTACFEFEHFMGDVKVCAQAAMSGSSLALIGNKVLEHFLLALHLRLERRM